MPSVVITEQQRQEIRELLQANPGEMTLQLARRLNVPEAEIIRLLPEGCSEELDLARWQEMFTVFAEWGNVHVIVSNAAVTCEVVGEFGGFSVWEEFFNVQSSSLDLHIRWPRLGNVFAVEKPSHMDGGRTLSIQFFDDQGHSAIKVFLNFGGKLTPEKQEQFTHFKDRFRRSNGVQPA